MLEADFSKNFIWATATAAYQIEGGDSVDGRTPSTWDEIRKESNRIADLSDAFLSCEGYKCYREDVKLLTYLGVTHYRFSLSWSRILPCGTMEEINELGIAHYRSLLLKLIDSNIQPIVTLFHADYPLSLYDKGGWLKKESIKWFTDFSHLCFERFGDLVTYWITFNEIPMYAFCNVTHFTGMPNRCPTRPDPANKRRVPYIVAHNMLMAHAKVYRVYQKKFKVTQKGKIGITVAGRLCKTFSFNADHIMARDRAMDWSFHWTVYPIFGMTGDYPNEMKNRMDELAKQEMETEILPKFTPEDKLEIRGSADFLGVNYYRTQEVGPRTLSPFSVTTSILEKDGGFDYLPGPWDRFCGEESWIRFAPEGLLELLIMVKQKYANIPVMITENGCPDLMDEMAVDSNPLIDDHRIQYIKAHIEAVRHALREGCNVIGYTVWSLLDNFEWEEGFKVRFGMFRVNFESSEKNRTAKKSVEFYREFIRNMKNSTIV